MGLVALISVFTISMSFASSENLEILKGNKIVTHDKKFQLLMQTIFNSKKSDIYLMLNLKKIIRKISYKFSQNRYNLYNKKGIF